MSSSLLNSTYLRIVLYFPESAIYGSVKYIFLYTPKQLLALQSLLKCRSLLSNLKNLRLLNKPVCSSISIKCMILDKTAVS